MNAAGHGTIAIFGDPRAAGTVRPLAVALAILATGSVLAGGLVLRCTTVDTSAPPAPTGRSDNIVCVLTASDPSDWGVSTVFERIRHVDGIARLSDGTALISLEQYGFLKLAGNSGSSSDLLVRGMTDHGLDLRRESLEMLEGRSLNAPVDRGLAIVGRSVMTDEDWVLGHTIPYEHMTLRVGGVFAAHGNAFESETWTTLESSLILLDGQPSRTAIVVRALPEFAATGGARDQISLADLIHGASIPRPDSPPNGLVSTLLSIPEGIDGIVAESDLYRTVDAESHRQWLRNRRLADLRHIGIPAVLSILALPLAFGSVWLSGVGTRQGLPILRALGTRPQLSRIGFAAGWATLSGLVSFVSMGTWAVSNRNSVIPWLLLGLALWPAAVLVTRRLSDLGWSRWTALLMLLPVANIVLLLILYFWRGTYLRTTGSDLA